MIRSTIIFNSKTWLMTAVYSELVNSLFDKRRLGNKQGPRNKTFAL